MKKILIVDDSKLNRIIVRDLINEVIKDIDTEQYEVLEAENGQEAVEIANQGVDLVFMDIMMPIKNGIEATEEIKKKFKKTMIVAVSALEEEEYIRNVLKNGAEDYIIKPLNGEVFKKRVLQYLTIVNSRNTPKFTVNYANLFDSKVYSHQLIFSVANEQALGEFWEHYLITGSKDASDDLADAVRMLYALGSWQLKLKYNFQIIVEENEQNIYFTMTNMKLLNNDLVVRLVQKNYPTAIFAIVEDKISFLVERVSPEALIAIEDSGFESADAKEDVAVASSGFSALYEQGKKEKEPEALQVFDFIEKDDLEELEYFAAELGSLMLLVGSSRLEVKETLEIANFIGKFGSVLNQYGETYAISQALASLSTDIEQHSAEFIEKSKDISVLCQAFSNDLSQWLRKLFYEGVPTVDFLDKSIISNANMISSFVNPPPQSAIADLDDIFDF